MQPSYTLMRGMYVDMQHISVDTQLIIFGQTDIGIIDFQHLVIKITPYRSLDVDINKLQQTGANCSFIQYTL